MTSKGKMILESKDDMKKRGLKSPDKADAFVLTFGEYMVEPDELVFYVFSYYDTNYRKCIDQEIREYPCNA